MKVDKLTPQTFFASSFNRKVINGFSPETISKKAFHQQLKSQLDLREI